MYVLSVFDPGLDVELAVTALTQQGTLRQNILASAVEKETKNGRFFDTINTHNVKSQFDLPMLLGTLLALLGCIYGFILHWGPVIWGVLGGLLGFAAGLLMKYVCYKKAPAGRHESEVVILVACEETTAENIGRLLRDNGARGVSLIKPDAAT